MPEQNGCKIIQYLRKYWWIIIFIFGVGGWVTNIEMTLASQKSKSDTLNQILMQQTAIQTDQKEMMKEMKGQIDVILILLGIKVNDSTIAKWKKMAKSLPLDSLGHPVPFGEWLCVSNDYLLGRTFKWVNNDSMLVRIEWDERAK